jgi:replicative DNA helicase
MNPRDLDPTMLPWSVESESSVLGGLLQDNEAWDRVSDVLEPKHFYEHAHGLIFGVISGLIVASKAADVVTVYDALEKQGKGEEVGGLAYLASLAQYVPSASNIRRYAEIVAERAVMRGMLESADKAKELATAAGAGTVAERLNEAVQLFQGLQVHRGRQVPRHISEGAVAMLARIDDLAAGRRTPGLPTRIPGFNRLLSGGFKPGKQVVIAARPSIGKSSLALAILLGLAQDCEPCAFLSQEMEAEELTDRTVANMGEVNLENLIMGRLDADEWSRMTAAVDSLKTLPLYFDEQPALTMADIQAKARILRRQHGIKVLVLDYLQLCAGNPKADKRHHQIEEITRGLKTLAKQLGITIVTISQLSRDVERRTSGKPVLSDLKESGAIEEDADVVILLSTSYSRGNGQKVIEADFAKNRQGRKGSVMLAFDGEYQRWVETVTSDRPQKAVGKSYTEDV